MGRGLWLLVGLLGTVYGCGADETPDREDAGELADASYTYEGLSCAQLVQEVLKLPRECDEATGCALVGTSCTPSRLLIAVNSRGFQRATDR